MNLSHRIFLVTADDEIVRLPNNHFERVVRMNPTERVPEYARQRMRVAEIIIDSQNRKPVDIVRGSYWYLYFDNNGTADYEKLMRHGALSMEASMGGHAWFGEEPKNVVRASHRFAARRRDHEARWKPSARLESRIFDAALGVIRCRIVATVSAA